MRSIGRHETGHRESAIGNRLLAIGYRASAISQKIPNRESRVFPPPPPGYAVLPPTELTSFRSWGETLNAIWRLPSRYQPSLEATVPALRSATPSAPTELKRRGGAVRASWMIPSSNWRRVSGGSIHR